MLGLNFEKCNKLGLEILFENCILDHSIFYKTNLKNTIFKNSQIQKVDFSECDLTNATFDNCDLTNTTFDNTVLENANFKTAFNFTINPEVNNIKNAIFSYKNISGLLSTYKIKIE